MLISEMFLISSEIHKLHKKTSRKDKILQNNVIYQIQLVINKWQIINN